MHKHKLLSLLSACTFVSGTLHNGWTVIDETLLAISWCYRATSAFFYWDKKWNIYCLSRQSRGEHSTWWLKPEIHNPWTRVVTVAWKLLAVDVLRLMIMLIELVTFILISNCHKKWRISSFSIYKLLRMWYRYIQIPN